ncbi:polyprenol phosphate mannosyl transferase 1 [Mycobacteroides abscessus subsp. abscessus]|nr:polyprenol phosphate mannosyl transferase 1 [Mycobacteroides abscessus subsp. abscessus]SKS53272.1 polyprenol phosphate mannosyl transferase 1 [Mycobacteroides abscessus subsp. abscessus]
MSGSIINEALVKVTKWGVQSRLDRARGVNR